MMVLQNSSFEIFHASRTCEFLFQCFLVLRSYTLLLIHMALIMLACRSNWVVNLHELFCTWYCSLMHADFLCRNLYLIALELLTLGIWYKLFLLPTKFLLCSFHHAFCIKAISIACLTLDNRHTNDESIIIILILPFGYYIMLDISVVGITKSQFRG